MKNAVVGFLLVVLLLAGILAVAVLAIHLFGERRIETTYDAKVETIGQGTIPDVARGKHIYRAIGTCVDCHGEDLGGGVKIDDPLLGTIVATNLTAGLGSAVTGYTETDWIRSIRHGIGRSGRALILMPSNNYFYFSDYDLASLIEYLKTSPPVDKELPPTKINLPGKALLLKGDLPTLLRAEQIDHAALRPIPPIVKADAEYGRYLFIVGGCFDCHRNDLKGGNIPGAPPGFPPATDITQSGIGAWSEADYFNAMRNGIRPDGSSISPVMPWRYTAGMTDDELRAQWLYLKTFSAPGSTPAPIPTVNDEVQIDTVQIDDQTSD